MTNNEANPFCVRITVADVVPPAGPHTPGFALAVPEGASVAILHSQSAALGSARSLPAGTTQKDTD